MEVNKKVITKQRQKAENPTKFTTITGTLQFHNNKNSKFMTY